MLLDTDAEWVDKMVKPYDCVTDPSKPIPDLSDSQQSLIGPSHTSRAFNPASHIGSGSGSGNGNPIRASSYT
jgi:hypothetical protein